MTVTGLDFILIVVMLLSALLAMMRGFTREVLSIVAWGLAAVATVYAYTEFRDFAREQLQPNWLADLALVAGTFFLVLILVSFATVRVSDVILDSRVGALDRTLGFVFGLGRGLLLVVIAYMFVNWLVPPDRQPEWVAEARSKPLLQDTGDYIVGLLPEDPEEMLLRGRGGAEERPADEAPQPGPEQRTEAAPEDYRATERRSLDQLVEGTRGASR
jgi:membrane protein required for colicin V production